MKPGRDETLISETTSKSSDPSSLAKVPIVYFLDALAFENSTKNCLTKNFLLTIGFGGSKEIFFGEEKETAQFSTVEDFFQGPLKMFEQENFLNVPIVNEIVVRRCEFHSALKNIFENKSAVKKFFFSAFGLLLDASSPLFRSTIRRDDHESKNIDKKKSRNVIRCFSSFGFAKTFLSRRLSNVRYRWSIFRLNDRTRGKNETFSFILERWKWKFTFEPNRNSDRSSSKSCERRSDDVIR